MSDVMLIGILRMPLNLVFPSEPDSVMALQIHARMGEAADRIEADEKEIARLLAVEAAAKKLDEALEWVMKDYEDMCRKSLQQSANWKKRVVMAKASSKAFQRSINPIGERK